MSARIKLCGLSRFEDIDAVNRLLPDFVGFVFFRKSHRFVDDVQAACLRERLDGRIQAVGVFVREEAEHVARLWREGTINAAQLHGGEDADYVARLRRLAPGCPIIQAFRMDAGARLECVQCSLADWVLVDSGYGGTGELFDWKLLQGLGRPYFLAGGLTSGNVGQAIRTLSPFGVDVSSGIETNGSKDPQKMAAFVAAVREAA